MVSNPPEWLVNWAQVIGSALSLLALVVAFVAIRASNIGLVRERRRQHELEILRTIGELLVINHRSTLNEQLETKARIAANMMMLPRTDFSVVRAALAVAASSEQADGFKTQISQWLASPNGKHHLDDADRDFPNRSRDELTRMVANFDAPRWDFVTQHEHEDGANYIYGYSSNSIAVRELTAAIRHRLE